VGRFFIASVNVLTSVNQVLTEFRNEAKNLFVQTIIISTQDKVNNVQCSQSKQKDKTIGKVLWEKSPKMVVQTIIDAYLIKRSNV